MKCLFSNSLSLLACSLTLAACISVPKGELQLGPQITSDMQSGTKNASHIGKGRPIYVEARSYPQILESGDIWAGGTLMVNIGREDLSLDEVISPLPTESEPAEKAKGVNP